MSNGLRIVVVGANVAGIHAAESLRARGFDGSLTVIDCDEDAPYNRPPLSKEYLLGTLDERDLGLISSTELATLAVEISTGVRARGLDMDRRILDTTAGEIRYDKLLVATGSSPTLPPAWSEHPGVCILRTLEDARRLRTAMAMGVPRVVVIGGGVIGCEIAATAAELGLHVTILEAASELMSRVLPPALARPLADAHRDHGVHVLCGEAVHEVSHHSSGTVVKLTTGRTLEADLVVVGVGARPNTSWLQSSGLAVRDGVVTDAALQASVDVFAAGDVARVVTPTDRNGSRVEHWTNARRQGDLAAASMLGQPPPRTDKGAASYVWSDQFGVRLQVTGSTVGDEMHVVRRNSDTGHHLTLIGHANRVVGAVSYGLPGFAKAKRLVTDAADWKSRDMTKESL